MKIKRGTILLKRVAKQDIELIRRWRNSETVSRFMEYREHITEEMQQEWFRKIDTDNNLYFLIMSDHKSLGLIYGADINWEDKTVGNAGIFIAEEGDRESAYALEASVLLNDYAFSIGIETIFIKVLKDNRRAIAYNKLLGYALLDGQENAYNQNYFLSREAYLNNRRKLVPLLKNTGDFHVIV
ncbi:MAG TPA: GNAT family N-acetyltransferase [Chitinophagaceae bacterium]|nr:GNAT family N-acetyltransferase [Chitinophagaceae bacterium]